MGEKLKPSAAGGFVVASSSAMPPNQPPAPELLADRIEVGQSEEGEGGRKSGRACEEQQATPNEKKAS